MQKDQKPLESSSEKNAKLLYSAIDIIKAKGFEHIRASISDYEDPAPLTKKGTEKSFIPDITARTSQGKSYFEIVPKSTSNIKNLVDKWTLLSSLAQHRNGTFFLLVPHGKLSFTNKLIEKHSISADILKIK
ncbi:hypothetical protein BH23BAC1_BH23BAC1_26600 [soil metagenome]